MADVAANVAVLVDARGAKIARGAKANDEIVEAVRRCEMCIRDRRMVGSELTAEDLDVDRTLRPQRLDDYCGQELSLIHI